ncbi:MAG TPA: MFS transporter [Verrucomicrobiae bacterium]|nr:MFS transporter [Verrucomicrobiae bacterium]
MSVSRRLENLPVMRFHYILLISAGLGWMFDSMDTGIISFVLPVLMKSFKLSPEQIGFIGSVGLAGMAVGAVFSGTLADYFGRKKVFAGTLVIYSIATGLCGWAGRFDNFYAMLLVFRFFVGFGLGGQLPVAVTLVSEFSPARQRGRFLVLLESFWAVGWLLAAVIAYLVIDKFGWPIAFYIGALPALYAVVIWRSIPESPRYLERRGRHREAEEIVARLEIMAGREPGQAASGDKVSSGQGTNFSIAELFSRDYLKRTIFLWILWFCIVFSYYGIFVWLPSLLSLKLPLVKSFQFVLIMTLAQIPGYFSAAYLVEVLGRKITLAAYLALCGFAAFFFGKALSQEAVLFWGCLMSFFNLGAWGIVYTYTPELYPTRARATGSGWAAGFGRIGGILAPSVVGWMVKGNAGSSFIFGMFAVVLLVGALDVVLLGEETKGRTLDELTT